ncbi:ABC transporter ATP-binding protein [Staphylococcus edaphicus]|uniref:ABC transporter ATP-binding protein n=1 Tax=Staphylococcus edaphicus TaxID=1955013 RepID=A0A2C6WK37_9STAP|nr:ABC transporter ATP-binding protein [Staphylococcus edaphicus]PHK48739.1 multidrug ABC transporter ATP-binding protein [Staphylococcus edaphicus]UQW81664.1 ABC transporter ATP-binding protein [Staphylococcus edaphicus]
MEHLLEIQNLNKSYDKSDFNLSNISLTLDPNEVVGVIGKNGSGKSTLFNTLVGNRFKDSGNISYFGQQITDNDDAHKENIGVVFDDLRIPNKLTLNDVSKVFANIYGTWHHDKFFSIIKDFELPANNEIKSFSRGMRMKAALAIALGHDSKILILDEATAGMDASGREEVIELLEDYVSEGNGILISSHISEDIEQLATKLVFMKDGRIILEEDKQYLLDHYGIVEQPESDFNLPNDAVVATRKRKDMRVTLVNHREAVSNARPLDSIDDATKLIMRGEH